jgi:repressor LexA
LLTELEKKILDAIKSYIDQEDKSPTLSEIGNLVGVSSKGTVHRYVDGLIEKGYLERNARGWRGLSLVQDEEPAEYQVNRLSQLPLVGRIAAGQPIEAITGHEHIDVSDMFVGPNRYVLQVKGESMIDAGIMDGDYVIIEQRASARDGEIVVALIDREEATLKRFKKGKEGIIELHPENQQMIPMRYPEERVQVQGVLVGVLRTY